MNKGCAVGVDRIFTAAGVGAAWLVAAGRGFVATAVLLLSFFCALPCAAGTRETPPAGKLLQVRVRAIDTRGKPIAGALIETWQSGGEGLSWWIARRVTVNGGKEVRTGRDGWATVAFSMAAKPGSSRTPRGAFSLTAQANSYLIARSGAIHPAQAIVSKSSLPCGGW